jgi:hypothetical protein
MILCVEIVSLDIEFCFLHGADFAADSGAARDRLKERERRERREGERERDGRERKGRVLALIV